MKKTLRNRIDEARDMLVIITAYAEEVQRRRDNCRDTKAKKWLDKAAGSAWNDVSIQAKLVSDLESLFSRLHPMKKAG